MATSFSPAAMKFLRGLARNNDREWFEARRDVYESELKAPALALIGEVNHAMEKFAPEHIRDPRKVMMRIYRDIRFSPNKAPYKTHVSAWWSRRGMEKTSGGGYYFHFGPKETMISAGCYMPEREQLLAIRRWMSENHVEFRKLLKSVMKPRRGEPGAMTLVDAQYMTRMPKGFAADDPADELVRARNWGVHFVLPGEFGLEPGLMQAVARGFERAAPLVDALNAAIAADQTAAKRAASRPMF